MWEHLQEGREVSIYDEEDDVLLSDLAVTLLDDAENITIAQLKLDMEDDKPLVTPYSSQPDLEPPPFEVADETTVRRLSWPRILLRQYFQAWSYYLVELKEQRLHLQGVATTPKRWRLGILFTATQEEKIEWA